MVSTLDASEEMVGFIYIYIHSAHRYLAIKQHFSTVQVEYWDDDGSEIDCDVPSNPPTEEDMCSTQTHQLDSMKRAVVWWVGVFTTVFGNPPLTATESNPVALEISFMRLDSYGYVFTKDKSCG